MQTPWGKADSVTQLSVGILEVTTPSHGGFKLDETRIALMHPAAQLFVPFAGRGWYEEDCDAAVVMASFPDLFGREAVTRAKDFIRSYTPGYFPDALKAALS